MAADLRTVTVSYAGATPDADVFADVYENPGVTSCPMQGHTPVASAAAFASSGTGTLTLVLGQPLPAGTGIDFTLSSNTQSTTAFNCAVTLVPPPPAPTPPVLALGPTRWSRARSPWPSHARAAA